MKCRDCCRRESYACAAAVIVWIFEIVAIATPWYGIGATNLPGDRDTFSALFWWSGMEALYSPPIYMNERTYNIGWSDMKTTMPKDVYMSCIALCFLALFADTALIFIIIFGQIVRGTSRMLNMMFCGYFKWVVVGVALLVNALIILSWTIFFAFPAALNDAKVCPGTTSYPYDPFSLGNTTCIERLWCDSFANSRLTKGETNWVWAPSVGWVFAVICTVFSLLTLGISLTVPTGQEYESIPDSPRGRRRDRSRRRADEREMRFERELPKDSERKFDEEKMKRKYNRFEV